MDTKNKRKMYMVFYALIFVLTSAPVFCGYVMEGGDAAMWLARIWEVKNGLSQGAVPWFPSAELTTAYGSGAQAFDSALWLLVPVLLQLLGVGEQMAWCLFMGMIQLGTLAAAGWMMKGFFREAETVLWGVLFYMSSPCHLYVCYDKADLGLALVWMLCPMFLGGLARLYHGRGKSLGGWCASILAYGGIWYADARLALLTGAMAACCLLFWKRWILCILPIAAGGILALPSVIYLMRYLLKGGMQVWGLPMNSIMEKGYVPGRFLTVWTYRPDLPGLGLGLLCALLLLAWLCWTGDGGKMPGSVKGILVTAGVLTVLSLQYVPWDYVQRLGMPLLRYIGLLETSGVFWGCANMLLGIPGAWAVSELRRKKEDPWGWIVPVVIMLCALATALYMCNTWTYLRLPLGQEAFTTVVY